jgi:hypothetical protein
MANLNLNDIMSSVMGKESVAKFVEFTQLYISESCNPKEIKQVFNEMNCTPEALNELAEAAKFLNGVKRKLSVLGIVVDIGADYDFKSRIVFRLRYMYNINTGDKVTNIDWIYHMLNDTEKSLINNIHMKIPRVVWDRVYISNVMKKYIHGSLDELCNCLEYAPISHIGSYQPDIVNIIESMNIEMLESNRYLTDTDRDALGDMPTYNRLCELENINFNFIASFLEYQAGTTYSMTVNVAQCINEISRDNTEIVHTGGDVRKNMLVLFSEAIVARTYIKEIINNPAVRQLLSSAIHNGQVQAIISRIKSEVERNVNDLYGYRMARELCVEYSIRNSRVRRDVAGYKIEKGTLARLLLKAMQIIPQNKMYAITIRPAKAKASSNRNSKTNLVMVGNTTYKIEVDANHNTYMLYKEMINNAVHKLPF